LFYPLLLLCQLVMKNAVKLLPFNQRHTLQLVQTSSLSVIKKSTSGGSGWRGCLNTATGQILQDAKITDPVFVKN
ncbi:hypothetical protein RIF25_04635, partial [Thermosynechococcaceae cyanobacterium BACA0444]